MIEAGFLLKITNQKLKNAPKKQHFSSMIKINISSFPFEKHPFWRVHLTATKEENEKIEGINV